MEGEGRRTCARCSDEARQLLARYDEVDLQHVPREENADADALVNAALDADDPLMVLWLAFGAIFGVWNVFQSTGLDFRLVAIGALLPTLIDAAVRRAVVRAHVARRGRACSSSRCSRPRAAGTGCAGGAR